MVSIKLRQRFVIMACSRSSSNNAWEGEVYIVMPSRLQEVFFEVFESLPRQGPGNQDCTRRAFEMCSERPSFPRVLDLGCGAGAQTLDLASWIEESNQGQETTRDSSEELMNTTKEETRQSSRRRLGRASILAIDTHAPFVHRLCTQIARGGWSPGIEARVADMATIELPENSFDLVWSEGALYQVGLEQALARCRAWLRPGGYLAFTDAVWRREDPASEVQEAFADYPAMGRVEDVLARLYPRDWSLVGHFDLPDEAWWEDFYRPLEHKIATLRTRYRNDAESLAALDELAKEPQMHRLHGDDYGYTFFVARRREG